MSRATPGRAVPGEIRSLAQSYAHCVDITRDRARNFYGAFLTLPYQSRQAICAVYAFCRRLDDIADGPAGAAEKADALRQERERLRASLTGAEEEPLYTALADTVRRYDIPTEHLVDVVDGVSQDLTVKRYRTFSELERYCYLVASAVGLSCLEIFGYARPEARDAAVALGIAMQLTNVLRDVAEDAENERIYLPLEDLARFGVTEEEILGKVYSSRFKRLMAFESERAKEYYASAKRLFRCLPRRSRPCPMVLMGVYRRLLSLIEKIDYDVFTHRVRLTKAEKAASAGWLWMKGLLWFPPR